MSIVPLETFLTRRFGGVLAGWRTLIERHWLQRLDRLAGYVTHLKEQEMDDLKVTAPPGEPIFIMTRSFNAPRALVWKAMTEREHIARWWGLKNSKIKVLAHDFRVGGEWRYGQEYAGDEPEMIFYGKYTDIQPTTTYTNTFGIEGMYEDEGLHETHLLEEKDGVTLYTSTSKFRTVEARDGMAASGMEVGARETLNRLEELLEDLKANV